MHMYYWRSRDGEEIDFLIQKDPQHFIFTEAKVSPIKVREPWGLPEVKKVFKEYLLESFRLFTTNAPVSVSGRAAGKK